MGPRSAPRRRFFLLATTVLPAGFVGSRLSKTLLARGDEVVGFDNFDPYYDRAHKDRHLSDLLDARGFTFIKGDLRDAPHHLLAREPLGEDDAEDHRLRHDRDDRLGRLLVRAARAEAERLREAAWNLA